MKIRVGDLLNSLNLKKTCDEYRVSLWACPQFLFVVMGIIIIISIIGTNIVAQKYAEPEISALIVMGVTAFLFLIGHAIISSFERVAEDSKTKSEFISIVSHELRNPLTHIGWQLDLMCKNAPLPQEVCDEAIATLREQTKKMATIVNNMLAVHRLEEKAFELSPEKFSIVDLAKHVLTDYETVAKKSGSAFEFAAEDNLPEVFADKKKIQMAIEHFVDNAIKYGKAGQTIKVSVGRKNGFVELTVSDQGMGIPPEDLKKIFGKFFRAHNAARYKIEGIGLGLHIVRSVIEKSGGRVGFTSREGQGSTFWFTLPAQTEQVGTGT